MSETGSAVPGENQGEDSQVSMDSASLPESLKDNGFYIVPPDPLQIAEEVEKLKEELKTWKEKVKEAEDFKAKLLIFKSFADGECAKAEERLKMLKDSQEEWQKDRTRSFVHDFILLNQENTILKKEIEKLQKDLEESNSPSSLIKKKVAGTKMKFSHLEEMEADCSDMDTHCVFGAAAKIPFTLNNNQALLTFEDEKVAQRLIEMRKHTVNLDNKTADVTVEPLTLEMGFQFELHVTISGKKINVSDIPELALPEDWMRDKLELNFYKTKQGGGGEIENVTYNQQSRTAVITFRKPGASNNIVKYPKYPFCADGRFFKLSVSPSVDLQLKKFQPYCGVSTKTILLKGIQKMEEDEESVQDMIEIHFQKPSNGGGEIEKIKYNSKGTACVCFEGDTENATQEISVTF